MPQIQLPIFPPGTTPINQNLGIEKKDGRITYFNGSMPVFVHDEDDLQTFRMITSQFYINGNATQAEICRAFGVPTITVKRAVKKYREEGVAGFYQPKGTRGAGVLLPDILTRAQALLDQGKELSEIAKTLAIKYNTLNKATHDGRLHQPAKKKIRAKS